jgi:hypothetical protein
MGGSSNGIVSSSNNDTAKDATLSFQEVVVTEGGHSLPHGQKRFTDVAIEASLGGKEVYVGSSYKVKWKYVSKLECWEDGFLLQMYSLDHQDNLGSSSLRGAAFKGGGNDQESEGGDGRSFEVRGPVCRRGSPSWESFQKLLQDRFQKEERKRQRRREEEREREERRKREGRNSTIGRKRRPQQTYSKRPLDFMKRNAANFAFNASSSSPTTAHFDFDSDGDDQIFQQYMSRKERGTVPADSRKRNRPNEKEDETGQYQSNNEIDVASEGGDSQPDESGYDMGAMELDNADDDGEYKSSTVVGGDASFYVDEIDIAARGSEGNNTANDEMGLSTCVNTTTMERRTKPGRQFRRLKKRTPVLGEDSDDDNALFGGPGLTTPGVQRVVSPGTSTEKRLHRQAELVDVVKEEMTIHQNAQAKANGQMTEETDSDATPALEGEDNEALPKTSPITKVTAGLKPKQSIASFFMPVRSAKNQDAKLAASKLKDEDPSNLPARKIIEVDTVAQNQAYNDENSDGDKDESDENNRDTEANLSNRSGSQQSQHAMVARKSMSAQNFFNPRPKRFNNSDSCSKEEDDTDGNSTVVLNTPASGSHYSDVIQADDDDEKSDCKPKQSNTAPNDANQSTPARRISKKYEIVRKSAKEIEEEDPINEIDSSQSPLSKTPSSWKSLNGTFRPRKRLGKTYLRSQNAFRALDFADARSPLNGSPLLLTTERSPLPAVKSPHKQSPLMPKRIGISSRMDDMSSSSSPQLETRPKWRGLKNNGNTCYINASLQMLFSVPQFMRAIRGLQDERLLVKNLVSVWSDLTDSQRKGAASARGLKDAMDELTDRFHGFQQRDAHEFLGELIDMIHEELQDRGKEATGGNFAPELSKEHSKNTKAVPINARAPTDDFFRLDVQVCLKCKSCGYSR